MSISNPVETLTVSTCSLHGEKSTNVYGLFNNGDHFAIINTHRNGEALINEYGGLRYKHMGSRDYILRIWRELQRANF